jgi:DNA-binding NarL/FixJ family response regulator
MGQKFLVVDDHPLMREAVRTTLILLQPDSKVAAVSTLAEAMVCLEQEPRFDLTLLDLCLPDAVGTDGLKQVRSKRPDCPVVVLSADVEGETILRCIEMGACGYIPKTLHSDAVMNALRMVVAGDIYIPHQAIAPARTEGPKSSIYGGRANHRSTDPRDLGLTERQLDVLRLILKGFSNKLICRQLKLAEGTIKVHVSAVLRALGVHNRTQAIIAASQIGLKISELERSRAEAV